MSHPSEETAAGLGWRLHWEEHPGEFCLPKSGSIFDLEDVSFPSLLTVTLVSPQLRLGSLNLRSEFLNLISYFLVLCHPQLRNTYWIFAVLYTLPMLVLIQSCEEGSIIIIIYSQMRG